MRVELIMLIDFEVDMNILIECEFIIGEFVYELYILSVYLIY